tara:strand:- start:228 stop:467 length:240 start_codon:yes stop_codon:yes gene_type:complete
VGRIAGYAVELVGHFTQRFGKPEWNIETTEIDGKNLAVDIDVVIARTSTFQQTAGVAEVRELSWLKKRHKFASVRRNEH